VRLVAGRVSRLTRFEFAGSATARTGLSHIHDQGTTRGQSASLLEWGSKIDQASAVFRIRSARLPEWFLSKPILLVLDEANQATEHDLARGTPSNRATVPC
jgi:hypothetical protein